jgi:nicotinate-nucleotide--dimethylbenzimidazole phosphoribosyltransferase
MRVELPAVTRPDAEARRAASARLAELAVPDGALGRLAELGVWLAAAQGKCPPNPPNRARVMVIAGDHGVAKAGVSAYPIGATLRQVLAVHQQNAPVAVLARMARTSVRVVDVALDHHVSDSSLSSSYRIRRSSGRIDLEDAMTVQEVERAFAVGMRLADEEVDAGADLLIPASLGVGATTPASTLVAAVTGAEPAAVVGRGSGIDDNAWMRKAAIVRDALRRGRPHTRDPLTLLRVVGGADIAALTGFCLQAALRRTPVLIDGLVVGAAAVVADELRLGARDWWLLAQRSPEPAMQLVADHLDLKPILDLGVWLSDGTGAAAVVPLLQMSARLLAESVTAEDLGIA